jgi:hypothetical protein
VFGKRVPRISGPKRGEGAGGCRSPHNEALYLTSTPTKHQGDQIKKDKMDGACSMHGRRNS